MGHGILKKVNFYLIFSEKLIFRGKCHLNDRIMLNAFASLKLKRSKTASIMYKSLNVVSVTSQIRKATRSRLIKDTILLIR